MAETYGNGCRCVFSEIDTGELCTYMSAHLGPFRDVFSAVEGMNLSITKALQTTAQVNHILNTV